jgi:hypothetical protein
MNALVMGLHDRGLITLPQIATSRRELAVTLSAADIERLSELLRGCADRLEVANGPS